ncbi:aminotransferase class III-fold pyridoxal phosphate-dependent enzyme [Amylibacter sp.]|nr:aminotransferase class III-fold pyridoxal phosphate-dependent enzyme [Amylibacter sp.]
MKIIAIIQARMGSKRLPNKVLMKINETPLIEFLLQRLKPSKSLTDIVVACPDGLNDDILASFVEQLGFSCFRGSEDDVLKRFSDAAKVYSADIVVRITGDCPFVDFELVDAMVADFLSSNIDYLSNTNPDTYPDGLDVEIMTLRALTLAANTADKAHDREHVTTFIKGSELFLKKYYVNTKDFSDVRLTVDEAPDLKLANAIANYFKPRILYGWEEIIVFLKANSKLLELNSAIKRNEGAIMGSGQKLYKRAKAVIPGGTMLLSKRPEMFLPEKWPSYFSKAKGIYVWDLDGRKYTDMSIMGIGTNILGYGHPEVDEAVTEVVRSGNMSTLNCAEEVYLAEKLVSMHPWADMVRFARTGGEANAIAVRLARAATGKDNVAICGYHGWHDWYLSANLGNTPSLDGHLLPGLEPKGVPRGLNGTIHSFEYNNIEQFLNLIDTQQIGVVCMEVSRNHGPKNGFLQKVRNICSSKGVVLMFDECTSGFRQTFGGLHLMYGVEPDIAMFGKALGNGYAITAILGRREIMEMAQKTFVSSTFWTERIGPTAALKTLEVMERDKSWVVITDLGRTITRKWEDLAIKLDIPLQTWGLPALCGYTIDAPNALAYKTYVTQELLKRNILSGNSIYVSTEHNEHDLANYFEALEEVFTKIKVYIDNQEDIQGALDGPVCHAGFSRLN